MKLFTGDKLKWVRSIIMLWALISVQTVVKAQENNAKAEAEDQNCLYFGTVYFNEAARAFPRNVKKLFDDHIQCLVIQELPAKRMTRMLNEGKLDGDVRRVYRYLDLVKDSAIRIEEPIASGAGYLATHRTELNEIEDFKGIPIGYIHGFKWQREQAAKFNMGRPVTTSKKLMDAFNSKRMSSIIVSEYTVKDNPDSFKDVKLIKLVEATAHIYLHKKHAHLKDKINAAIKKFKAAGGRFDVMPEGEIEIIPNPQGL